MDLAHTGTPRVRNWSRTRQLLARKAVLRGDRSSLMPFGLAGLSRVTFTEALSAFLIVLAYLYASSTVRSRTRGTTGGPGRIELRRYAREQPFVAVHRR